MSASRPRVFPAGVPLAGVTAMRRVAGLLAAAWTASSACVAAELSAQDVLDYVAERVAPYKRVRAVTFVDAIPKSASGKILRKDLRAQL